MVGVLIDRYYNSAVLTSSAGIIEFQKGYVMKKTSVSMILGIVLFALVIWLSGCRQPGETTAEGSRRHNRNLSINQQELNQDLDKTFLLDKPSRLSDKRIP